MKQLYVIGMGPGAYEKMTMEAIRALEQSDCIVGYTVYNDLLKPHFPEKEFLQTGMTREAERCRMALEEAQKERKVAMVCSGDSGLYGMAGIIYEIAEAEFPDVEIIVIPGVSAAFSGADVLGAPITHDLAIISLSDLLTPWEKIEKRIRAAAQADFVIALYNPSSKKRHDYLQKVCDMMLEYKDPETVCGFVRNIGREGESVTVLTLKELRDTQVDMFTTVFVGNSQTKDLGGHMVTPRGYKI